MATKKKLDLIVEQAMTDDVQCCGKNECVDCPFDVVEPVVVAPVAAGTYLAVDGDSYPAIAGKFKPVGMTKHEYAVKLFELNGGKQVVAGMIVKL